MELVGDNIAHLKPYQPGKPIEELERELGISDSIKLASNENPLGPSPRAVEKIREIASGVHIYPDGGTYRLREALAEKHGVSMDEIIVGNGSNEVLNIIARTFCRPGDVAMISDYAFIAYRLILTAFDIPVVSMPTGEGFAQDLDAMAGACGPNTKILFLANPNNPTGVYSGAAELKRFLEEVPPHVIVVVDEAYVEYAQADDYASAMELRDVRERLVVCRTFSKCYGLAGLRVGYGVAPAEFVDYMHRVREPFNSNLVAQAAAHAALADIGHLDRSVESNEESRRLMEAGLDEIGLRSIPSQTNFLLVQTPKPGADVYEAMLRDGVIVRPLGGYGLADWLRITLGTPEQTERCIAALGRAVR